MKRKTALILSVFALLSVISASCGKKNGNLFTSSENSDTLLSQTTSESTVDINTVPEFPEKENFNGYDVRILVSGNYNNNDFSGETGADQVSDAQYKRNEKIMDNYSVKINAIDKIVFNSQKTGQGTAYTELSKSYLSSTFDYDFAMVGSYNAGSLAFSGYLTDLNSIPNVNLDKVWWSQTAKEEFEIAGKMFFTTGDITLADNKVVHLIIFNKNMIKSENLTSPYDFVRNGSWTWETLSNEVKKVSQDLDGNDIMNEKDKYGLMTWADAFMAAVASAGCRIATVNASGELELTLYSDRAEAIVEKYSSILFDTKTVFDYQYGYASSTWDTNRYGMFKNNQVLYYMCAATVPAAIRDSEVDFGVIPYPKLTEEQENYYSLAATFHNQFVCAPFFIENENRTGLLLEAFAYYGKTLVTPAYYEKSLVGTYIRDDESAEMLDIIYANEVYDPGLVYLISGMKESYINLRTSRSNTFTSNYQASKDAALRDIQTINEMYSKVLD